MLMWVMIDFFLMWRELEYSSEWKLWYRFQTWLSKVKKIYNNIEKKNIVNNIMKCFFKINWRKFLVVYLLFKQLLLMVSPA